MSTDLTQGIGEKPDVKPNDLIDAMTRGADISQAQARAALGAMAMVLEQALVDGRTIRWRGLGVIKPVDVKDTKGGQMVRCRVKLANKS